MIGLQELIIPLAIIALIALFGKKTIMKIIKDFIGIREEVKDINDGCKKEIDNAKPKDNKTEN